MGSIGQDWAQRFGRRIQAGAAAGRRGAAANAAKRRPVAGGRLVLALVLGAACSTACAHGQASDHFGSQVVVVPPSATQEYTSIAIDSAGNLYIGDQEGHKVYKETLSNGTYTQTVAVDLSSEPGFGALEGVAVDNKGNLYIADTADATLYMATPAGGGTYTQTVIKQDSGGDFVNPTALAVDSKGDVFCTAQTYNTTRQAYVTVMYEFTPAGGGTYTQTQVFTSLIAPDGLAIDSSDNLYIDDGGVPAVYKETLSGGTYTQSTVVDDSVFNWLDQPGMIAVDNLGDVFVANGGPFGYNALTVVEAVPAAGGTYNKRNFGGGFGFGGENQWDPYGIAADNNGNVFITAYIQDSGDFEVQELSSPPTDFGQVNVGSTSAAMTMSFVFSAYQSGGVSSSASGGGAGGEFVDLGTGTCATNGTSFLYEPGDSCTVNVTFTPKYAGQRRGVVTLVNSVHAAFAQEYLTGTGVAPQVSLYPGTVSTIGTGLTSPQGVAVDGQGIVYILDTGNLSNFITETPSGGGYTQGMVNYSGNDPVTSAAGLAVDGSDCLYANYDEQGAYYTGQFRPNTTTYTCEGIVADVESGSSLKNAQAVAVDGNGNVYIADTGDNRVIEEFYSSGSTFNQPANWVTVVADTGLSAPAGVTVDSKGNVYIADTGNNRILKEVPAGMGTFTQSVVVDSGLSGPTGLAVDAVDNLYISDTGNKRVLKETVSGSTYTQSVVLATGLGSPQGLALDGAGNIYIADMTNQVVVKVDLADPPTVNFASTAAGTTSSDSPQTVTVANVGTAALTFPVPSTGNNPSISANFSLSSTGGAACPLTTSTSTNAGSLAANASCTLPISFEPSSSSLGAVTGSLVLTDNTLNVANTIQTIPLNGTATTPTAPVASLSPTTLSFGNVQIGSSSTLSTTLSNTGNAALDITGITLNDNTNFSQTNTCGSSLAAGSTCKISVKFAPQAGYPFDATLSVADNAAGSPQTVSLSGTGTAPPVITETGNLWFNPAPVGIAAASAQTLTATFNITGEASLITPTATMHYGLAYKVGTVSCTGTAGNQTCTVPVTFIPNYPGGRRDALFLMNGTTRLASELAFGVGESPFAMIQPGVVTNALPNNNAYVYNSVVDENGTAWVYLNSTLYSVTAAGVVTELTVPGLSSNSDVSIDGAGILYFGAPNGNANAFVTYDTVQGIVGSLPTPATASYYDAIAAGNEGNLYMVDNDSNTLYTVEPDGTTTTFSLNNSYGNPYSIVVDTQENLFASNGGNGSTEEITPADVETKINTTGGGLGIDAANTVYVERFYGLGTSGVGELPASDYANAVGVVDGDTSPTGNASVAPDGTVYVGNYSNFDKVDRSQGTVSFGEQESGTAATPQVIQIYNGGNETLTLSNISISGEAFTIGTSASDNCSTTTGIGVGALCNLTVNYLPTHAGVYSGSITITSNSLNDTTTTQTIALSGFVYGVYVTAAPNPLAFGSVQDGNTSAPQTVTFTNNGDLYNASIGGFSSTDPAFVVTPSNGCSSVAVGASCTATVTFAPTAVQSYSATISFSASSSGGGANQSGSFDVTGTGTAAAAPAASLSPTTLTFGNETVGSTSAAQVTTLSNTGNATLDITGITLSDTTDYAKTTTCGSTLDAGKTCTISVTFKPGSAAAFNATLSVADNATGSPQTVALSGVGVAAATPVAQLVFYPATLNLLAGSFTSGYTGDNGAATSATLNRPNGVVYDAAGNLYIADAQNHVVRKVDTTGKITTFAGNGTYGYSGDNGPATSAEFQYPAGLAIDSSGNLYIADETSNVVRMVTPGGTITTFAGNSMGNPGYTGDGMPASQATLRYPYGLAFDAKGNLYIVDSGNNVVRIVNPSGIINTFAGTGYGAPFGGGYTGDGHAATSAEFFDPQGVAVDPSGNVYIADTKNYVVRVVNTSGIINTFAGNGTMGFGNCTTGSAATSCEFGLPQGVATAPGGDVYISDPEGNLWVVIGTLIYPVEEDTTGGLTATSIGELDNVDALNENQFVTTDPNGNLVVSNSDSNVITSAGTAGGLNFGNVMIYQTNTEYVQLMNAGSAALTFSAAPVVTGPFAISGGTCDLTTGIAPGAICTLGVTFAPTVDGAATGSIALSSNGVVPLQTIQLSANGFGSIPLTSSLSPTTLGFTAQVGSSSPAQTVTFTNTSAEGAITISGISTGSTIFTETNNCPTSLAAGASCAIQVVFSPTMASANGFTANMTVSSNTTTPQTVRLTGNATGGVSVSPTSFDFGSATEYTGSPTKAYFTITNSTSSTITISNFQSSDPAEFDSQDYTCPGEGEILAGTTCQFDATFFPLSVGPITATVSLPYTGAGGGTLVVNLSGTGTAGTPAIDLYPLPVAFGQLPVMTSATPISLQVEATGTAPLTGISASISGANAADFSESDNCSGVTVDPYPGSAGSCNITINFTPTAGGARNATLNVTSNGGAATFSTPLTGAGVATVPQIQFNPTQLNLFAGAGSPCADATSGGAATAATLCNVTGAAQDYLGNTYLADTTYNVVYKVDGTGNISVFAGTPSTTGGYGGDGAAATSATLSGPTAVAADAFGDVYISDTGNGVIREVIAATGDILTAVTNQCGAGGTGTPKPLDRNSKAKPRNKAYACLSTLQPEGLVVDNSGDVFFADAADNLVWEATPNGSVTVVAGDQVGSGAGTAGYNGDSIKATTAELNAPQDVALDATGNLYIADTKNFRIRLVTAATGVMTTFAGTGTAGNSGDGAAAGSADITAYGVATDPAGDVFITEGTGGIVRKVDASGNITTFAGGGTGALAGPASTGAIANSYFARVDNGGDLLIPGGLQVLSAGPDGLLQFATTPIGTTSSALTVTLENTGNAYLDLGTTVATVTGTDASDFALTSSNCGYQLMPGKTCALSVTFDPSATGARTASLSVPTNAAGSPQIVLLQGNGTAASAPVASLSPTTLSFPSTAIGSTAMLSTTLSNTGNATLNISGITLSDTTDFAETTTCGSTLAAGSTCTITVTFQPASATAITGTLSVADNAAGSPQTASLSGTGTPAPAPIASLSPTTLAFPSTYVGSTSAAMSTTLSNTGNATLTITSITLSDTTDFAETTTCGSTLAAGSTCSISVTFKPGSVANLTGTLSVADNAAGTPQTVALSGTGLQPLATDFSLTVTPPAQTVTSGTAATYTVDLKGIGGDFTNAVNLTVTGLPSGFTGSFSPASVTPGVNGGSSTLSIQTASQLSLAQPHPLHHGPRSPWLAALLVIPLLGLRKRLRKLRVVSCLLLLIATLTPTLLLSGCGGGYFAITSQTYTVTVTGSSGSTQHSTTVTLTVQQQ